MTLPKFATKEKVLEDIQNTFESKKATFGRKQVWSELIMLSCNLWRFYRGSVEKIEKEFFLGLKWNNLYLERKELFYAKLVTNTESVLLDLAHQRRTQGAPAKLISGGLQVAEGAKAPLGRNKFKPPWTNSWIRPL